MPEKKKQEPEMTFEQAAARLEEIVHSMENGKIPLDESIELFEEGVALVKLCNSKLDSAEQKVKFLTRGNEGDAIDHPYNGEASSQESSDDE